MATVSEILQIEDANDGKTITLFGEGGFYRAYNRSAWLACLLMKDFKVTKRHIKIVDRDIAFVGFPKGSLDTWAKGMQVKIDDNIVVLTPKKKALPQEDNYEEWFAEQEIVLKKQGEENLEAKLVGTTREKNIRGGISFAEVGRLVAKYPMESRSPMECMLFLARMRQSLYESDGESVDEMPVRIKDSNEPKAPQHVEVAPPEMVLKKKTRKKQPKATEHIDDDDPMSLF